MGGKYEKKNVGRGNHLWGWASETNESSSEWIRNLIVAADSPAQQKRTDGCA